MNKKLYMEQYKILEWSYESGKKYNDPSADLELDVNINGPEGSKFALPAFWSGGNTWTIRFSAPRAGEYQFKTICSDKGNPSLEGQSGDITAAPYQGDNEILDHGPLQVSKNKRSFEYADDTPFTWMGDTWWMGLAKRLTWPQDFKTLAEDRVRKGFSVIQIVAGLYPDMPPLDHRSANEAGTAWHEGFTGINPAYFDLADLKISWLVRSGLIPCIVGCWGYYLKTMGVEKMKQHWRYLIGRWSAYPVVWCAAGEATMPFYLSQTRDEDAEEQKKGWTELCRYIKKVDPYKRILTIHPTRIGRDQVTDDSVLDFEMLQTGHGGYHTVPDSVNYVKNAYSRKPSMPFIIGEANYEGIIHHTSAEIQRLTFWSAYLSGASGYTYGANGIWQVNCKDAPYGPSPHGGTWGNTPWDEAMELAGASQLGTARRIIDERGWRDLEPHPEWIDPAAVQNGTVKDVSRGFAAGIPGAVRVFYFFQPTLPFSPDTIHTVRKLNPQKQYKAAFIDPRSGEEHGLGTVQAEKDGSWEIPVQSEMKDWLLVMNE